MGNNHFSCYSALQLLKWVVPLSVWHGTHSTEVVMHRVILRSLGLTFAILGTTGIAVAADLPSPAPMLTKAPPLNPPFSWTGFYVGANAGGAWGRGSDSNSFFFPAATTTGNFNLSGAVAGGQLGYNWQTANWVFGLETDADWSSVQGSTSAGVSASFAPRKSHGLERPAAGWDMPQIGGCPS